MKRIKQRFNFKKLYLVLALLFATIFLTACGGAAFMQPIASDAPFGTPDLIREIKTYRVEVFAPSRAVVGEDGETISYMPLLGSGQLTQELFGTGAGLENTLTKTSNFYLEWQDIEEAGENRGLSDEIESSVTFLRQGFRPLQTTKTASVGTRINNNTETNNSYTFNINFRDVEYNINNRPMAARTSSISLGGGQERQFNIPTGTVFCNEQFYVLLRSFTNLTPGRSITFPIHHPLESYIRNSSANFTVQASAGVNFVGAPFERYEEFLGEFLRDDALNNYRQPRGEAYPGQYNYFIPAMAVGASIAGGGLPSGPSQIFYIAAPHINFQRAGSSVTTNRLILRHEHTIRNPNGTVAFLVVHTLMGYDVF